VRPILVRALSVVNIHLIWASVVFRCFSHRQFQGQGACLSQVVSERQLFGNFDPMAVWQFPAQLRIFQNTRPTDCFWRKADAREGHLLTESLGGVGHAFHRSNAIIVAPQ
jgi:hypothetical protein